MLFSVCAARAELGTTVSVVAMETSSVLSCTEGEGEGDEGDGDGDEEEGEGEGDGRMLDNVTSGVAVELVARTTAWRESKEREG